VTLADDVVVTVIPDGIGPLLHGFSNNADLPQYRNTVGQVKARVPDANLLATRACG
jgi:hypothetical protein